MSLTIRPKRSVHHKKASGAHHRQSKRYLKAYSPYLPLLGLIIIGLAINMVWTQQLHTETHKTDITTASLLQTTNETRLSSGEAPLQLNDKLSRAAEAKASDMVRRQYWSQIAPKGESPGEFIIKSGYSFKTSGENIAYGFPSADQIIAGWMSSSSHRAKLLNDNYQDVGFGMVTTDNFQGNGPTTVIVALYGEPSNVTSDSASTSSDSSSTDMRSVSRVQLMANGQASWSLLLTAILSLGATAWFLIRHAKAWHRVLVRSEDFVIHHKLLDVVIVTVAVAGFVLTRAAGFIQ